MSQDLAVIGNIETARLLSVDLQQLLLYGAVPLMCLAFVVWVGFKTKAAGPTLMACVLAAVVGWGASNLDLLSEKAGQDVTQYDDGGSGAGGGPVPR